MKVKGFGAWPLRNESSGGQKSSFDEYNRHLKGKAYQHYEEYASRYVEEYHHYQEQMDLTAEKDDDEQLKKKKKDQESRKRRSKMIQQVIVLAVGSLMITSAYQAHINDDLAKKQAANPDTSVSVVDNGDASDNDDNNSPTDVQPSEGSTQPATQSGSSSSSQSSQGGSSSSSQSSQGGSSSSSQSSQGGSSSSSQSSQSGSSSSSSGSSVSWRWNTDGSAVLAVTDSSGNVISEVPATVTSSESPATCRTEGRLTYTASASANGQTYSDTRTETLPALGHVFDDGSETSLDDGSTATDFECTRCHEHFIIKNSTTEE